MALDPNIALGVRPIEIANPLAQYGQVAQLQAAQNQNQLAQYQLGAAQRADVAAEGLNKLYAKHYDPVKGTINQNALMAEAAATPGLASQIPKLQELATKREQEAAALGETKSKTSERDYKLRVDKATKAITDIAALNSSQEAIASIDQHLANGDIDQQKADMLKNQLTQAPSFGAWQKGMLVNILDAKERLTMAAPKPTATNLGGKIVFLDLNPNSPTFQKEVVPAQTTTMTPGEIASNAVARGQLGVAQGRLALEKENAIKPVFNAATGGFVSPPTKANPQGTFTPVTGVQETKDQQAAVKALKSAGYDPTTGEDNISKLIAKSTSGGLQAGTAAALAFFGKTTEGRKALAALEGTANQIATDLAGGKLGAGISNTDRDFIVGALGDVSNPMKTSAERLAGWTAAKNRMMSAGVIPPAGAAATAAPNLDALLNKYK